jgi:hypothetical protein
VLEDFELKERGLLERYTTPHFPEVEESHKTSVRITVSGLRFELE